MEKRGSTSVHDICKLIKQANDEEVVLTVNMDGHFKYADNKPKPALVLFATGPRAAQIREVLGELLR